MDIYYYGMVISIWVKRMRVICTVHLRICDAKVMVYILLYLSIQSSAKTVYGHIDAYCVLNRTS